MLSRKKSIICLEILFALIVGCNGMNKSKSESHSSFSSAQSTNKSLSSSSTTTSNEELSSSSSENKAKPTRPHTHSFGEWEIIVKADLFNTGEKYHKCLGCELSETIEYYDLSEVFFRDKVYQESNKERTLTIDGLLPKGVTVRYTNNKLTKPGSIISTAHFLDPNGNILESRNAVLTIVPYRGLPNIKVNTVNNAQINSKEKYTLANFNVENCESEYQLNGVSGGIRWRGNGTLAADKKPYRIKFDEKQKMLGLNDNAKAKSWVLLAEYYDYSMMRNPAAYSLGDALMNGRGYYSSDFTHVNVYINGVYNGVYVLAEQQQVNKNRVDIYEAEENETRTDIGYLLEMDSYANAQEGMFNVGNASYEATDITGKKGSLPERKYSIKSDFYSPDQVNFISKYINNVYTIMYNAIILGKYYTLDENNDLINGNFTNAYDTLNAVMDVDSLVRSYILEEIMMDIDVGFSSYYMFVDFSENSKFTKLTFGAPWDFDWSSGNVGRNTKVSYNDRHMGYMNVWLFLLSKADFFFRMVHNYWTVMHDSGVVDKIIDEMDYISEVFKEDFDQNFLKWKVLGLNLHTYHDKGAINVKSHKEAVDYFANWLRARAEYLDSVWL